MKVRVHFNQPVIDGEQESLQEIIESAFKKCFILISNYQTKEIKDGYDIFFEYEPHDCDRVFRCLPSIFEGLGVEVEMETPFEPCLEFTIG